MWVLRRKAFDTIVSQRCGLCARYDGDVDAGAFRSAVALTGRAQGGIKPRSLLARRRLACAWGNRLHQRPALRNSCFVRRACDVLIALLSLMFLAFLVVCWTNP